MIIRRIPINLLQKSIYDILLVEQTTPVYDNIPEDSVFPYILISDYDYEIKGSKQVDISEITFDLEIWTDYKGKAEVNSIIEDIVAVLTAWPIDLSAHGFNVMSQDAKGGKGSRQGEHFYGVVNLLIKVQNVGI